VIRRPRETGWLWAFVSQGCSSASTLGLSLLAGRALGAGGLGIVFAGFAAYLIVLNLNRGLVSTPLISSTSTTAVPLRALPTRNALTVTLALALVAAGAMALAGAVVGGPLGEGLLVFAPWVVPAFAQDLFRASLFRDGHGRRAAVTDVAWLGTMAVAALAVQGTNETWPVVAAWGLGAVVAAGLGAVWSGVLPAAVSEARAWFFGVAFPFGRWLAVQEGVYSTGSYLLVALLTGIVGARGVGGLRAAETVFAPFSLLSAALVLPGLPAVSRKLTVSRGQAVGLAARISVAGIALTGVYLALMALAGTRLLTALFGSAFEAYGNLVLPICVWQVLAAAGLGFSILLRAEQRGRTLFAIGTTAIVAQILASSLLAVAAGVEGAAWGLSAGAAVGTLLQIFCGVRVAGAGRVFTGRASLATESSWPGSSAGAS
jgi:hypothetical protein